MESEIKKIIELLSLTNDIFKESKPLTGLEREILSEALLESSMDKPTLPGRL